MLRFLGRFRKRFLSDNSFLKYVLYATGEILLVMIGIILALQVNNANEQRKENALEQKLLKEIYRSVQRDSLRLLEINDNNVNLLKVYEELKGHLASKLPYHDSIGMKLSSVSFLFSHKVQNAPFRSLENAGLNIIKNDSLRIMIPQYYESMKGLEDTHSEFDIPRYFREHVYPKYFKSFSWGKEAVPVDYEVLRNASDFHVALDFVRNDASFYYNRYDNMYRQCENLLVKLRNEIRQMER